MQAHQGRALSTVGPYQLYGDELVAACVATGTDYADLCGEPAWMAEKIAEHHEAAKASGARICFSSGFDSIPFDLGVMMAQKEAKKRCGTPAKRIKGRVRAMAGHIFRRHRGQPWRHDEGGGEEPLALQGAGQSLRADPRFRRAGSQPSGMIPEHDKDLGKWAAPFVMAPINTKNVHRTNFLLGHPYGEDFKYDEMMLTSPGDAGKAAANAMVDMMKNPFGSKPPKPGEGPTAEERENGFYDIVFVAEGPGDEKLRLGVKGKYDPGYGSTSRMLSETGIGLLSCDAEGGVGTPGAFLGEALVKRLEEHAEVTFEVED